MPPVPLLRSAAALALLASACGGGDESPRPEPASDPAAAVAEVPDGTSAEPGDDEERYEAVAARLRAGAGRPEPLTEFATTAQRRAMDRAKVLLQQLSLDPEDDETRVELARVYEQSMLPDRALKVLGPVFERPPVSPEALFLAAGCLHVRSELDDALVLLDRTLAARPDHLGALELKAGILRRLGRLEEACAVARRGLEVHAFAAGLQIPLALAAWDAGDLAVADWRLERAVRDGPELLEARYLRARLLRELGRDEEAELEEAAHSRLVRLDDLGLPPGLPEPERLLALARSYRASGELERAVAELERLLAAEPHAGARALLSEIWTALGVDAAAAWDELAARHPHLADEGR